MNNKKKSQVEIDRENGYKICKCCNKRKNINQFYISRKERDGHFYSCKKCSRKQQKKYYNKVKNTEIYKIKRKKDRIKNKNYMKIYNQKRRKDPLIRLKRNKYEKERRKNVNYKLICYARSQIYRVIKGNLKSGKTEELLGCSIPDFINYIKSKWILGMNDNNHGHKKNQWSLDHILPIELFDMSSPKQQKICFHYTNLQPLWFADNNRKRDILPDGRFANNLTPKEKLEYLRSLGYEV